MNNTVIGEANFRFSSRFSQLIGRNLISNPVVAVSELVKNSYDADADSIIVDFKNLNSDLPELDIIDDGVGMSYDDVLNKWMVVGTDNKVSSPYTAKNRRKLGEKGIGRFSVERLSKKVEIISKQKGDDFAITFTIDWDEYEKSGDEFSEHRHQIFSIPESPEKQGTTIKLLGLRDIWTEDSLLDLQKELEIIRPININDYSYKQYKFPGDEVKIVLNAQDILNKKKLIETNFISFAQAHLFGEIYEDGSADIKIDIKSNISMSKNEIHEEYN